MANVESLELQITGDATRAKKSIDDLIASLNKLKQATKGGCGLSSVSKEMQKVDNSGKSVSTTNTKSAKSFVNLGAKVTAAALAIKKAGQVVSSWIKESNDYVENLNLFTVAMGEYAESAQQYAEKVGDAMGIDPSDWMRNQGVFMTLATGFGVAGDRAATMSTQLTQLGYDISSFFNISVADAMQKLQSGISGELEPLRRLGYDLSQAKLEATALSLGIDKAVSSMTQAEKAELRYYAIMNQVTTAQGDMARTLEAPANQLRIFSAQAKQAGRALGNIFIPALNAVLPYAIAFLKVVREAANWLANLFGFKLPEIDYSGVDGLASSGENASDALDEATGSAKKLKKTLLGIDELNVLPDTSSAAGAGGVGGTGGSFDFELPEYNFMGELSKKTDEAYAKVKKLLKPIKKLLDYLVEYKELVLLGVGLVAVTKLWKKLKTVWGWFAGLKVVDWFMNGFSLISATGGNFFQSIRGGLDSIRGSLTGVQKAAIVAVAAVVEFTVVKNNVRDLALGCENATGKIVGMTAAIAAAGVAMYTALGPWGLLLAAVVAVAGAVVGVTEAMDQMRKEVVDSVLFDGVGVSLDAFKAKLEALTEQYAAQNQQIIEWKQQIDSNNDTIDKVGLSIDTLTATLGNTGVVTQDEIDKIKGKFGELYEAVKSNMTLSEEVITTALVGALKRATPEIAEQIDLLIGEYQRYVRETQGRAEELKLLIDNGYDQLVGKHKDDPAYQEIMAQITGWYTELGYLNGSMSDAGWQWQQTVADFNSGEIDWGKDVEDAKVKLGEIAATGQAALDDLAAAKSAVLLEIDNAIAYASIYGTDEDVDLLGDIRAVIEADYAEQEAAIKNEVNAIFESLQNGMINETYATKESLEADWAEMNWFEHLFYNNDEEKYVKQGLEDLQEDIDTFSEAIQGHMSTLKTDGSLWSSEAMAGIIDALFSHNYITTSAGAGKRYDYAMSLEDAIKQVFSELEESGKKTSSASGEEITAGLGEGISGSASVAADAITDVVGEMDEAVRDAAEINSPSRLFAREAGYMMDGLTKGIRDGKVDLKNELDSVISSAFSTWDASSKGYAYGSSFADGISRAIRSASFPTLKGTVSTYGGTTSMSFSAYASGGYPTTGELFVANEAGPELVGTIGNRSAVVNNDQIVDSVSKGVYQAVSSAMSQSGGDKVVEAKVNDKVLFEVVVSRARQETVRTGYNPLLGGV